jgi:predicted nucleic acid-binding protein
MTSWVLDTGPLVAFFDRSEQYHPWAKLQWAQAPLPMLTCEPVLAEAAYLLQQRAGLPPAKLLALFERGILQVPFHLEEHAETVARLLERYQDQEIQIADACLIRMSELRRECRIFTLDKADFQVYRRFERQVIPLISPE